MDQFILSVATAIASFLAIGILTVVINSLKKIKNEGALRDIKLEALVHTIEKKLVNNSTINGDKFSTCYYAQVDRLITEHKFVSN